MHSEHFNLSSPVFLPITEHTCAGLLGSEGFDALVALSEPQLAAVLVIPVSYTHLTLPTSDLV